MRNGKTCFGVIIGTRAYFNSELAKDVRKQLIGAVEVLYSKREALPSRKHASV